MPEWVDLLDSANQKYDPAASSLVSTDVQAAIDELDAQPGWDGDIADIDIDGGIDIGSDLADEDLFIVDDGASGTNRKSTLSRVWTYVYSKIASASTTALQIGTHKESLYVVTTTGDITLDLANGMTQRVTLDANRQITLPADPAAFGQTFQLFIDCASFTPTWASIPTIKWLTDDQSPPTLVTTSGAVNVLIFTWDDSYNVGAGAWFGQYSNYASAT